MDNWEDNISKWFDDAQKEIDNFAEDLNRDLNKTFDLINQEVDQWIDEMSIDFTDLIEETDTLFNEIINLFFDDNPNNEDEFFEQNTDWEDWFTDEGYQKKPNPQKHPACVGCRHYHGQIYGGNLLVCGMHPYGWEDKNCPDWQKQT